VERAVLVIGDVIVDYWIDGKMTRISPEAPTPVVLQERQTRVPGGAANVAANLASLGVPTLLCGAVGADEDASWLRSQSQAAGIACQLLDWSGPTIRKTRVACGGQQVLRIDIEDTAATMLYPQAMVQAVDMALHANLVCGLVVADYAKGVVTEELARHLVERAAQYGIPIFVDTKPAHVGWFCGATMLKPNLAEAIQMCEGEVHPGLYQGSPVSRAVTAAKCLQARGFGAVLVTCGSQGAIYWDGQILEQAAAPAQEIYDVTGAGDTLLASFVAARMAGNPPATALWRGVVGGSEVVKHRYTVSLTAAALDAACMREAGPTGKIRTRGETMAYVLQQKREGKRIVLTNGCYRYLHQGHLAIFEWARARGDVLVVGVNSDASIRKLRGEAAQFAPEELRSRHIAQQPSVDVVVLFDETNVSHLVRDLRPDVLVKGDEYTPATVVGADFVAGYGGEVLCAPMLPGLSATKLLSGEAT
jgi:D-beta-D-heptose 7-phosphate kinase/D-beta-D-heptose 1-phosphate adenosyltransferase